MTGYFLGWVADRDHRLNRHGGVEPQDLGDVLSGAALPIVLAETHLHRDWPAADQS